LASLGFTFILSIPTELFYIDCSLALRNNYLTYFPSLTRTDAQARTSLSTYLSPNYFKAKRSASWAEYSFE